MATKPAAIIADEPGLESPTAPVPKLAKPDPLAGPLRGWMVTHPGYGVVRVKITDATNEAEAVERFRSDLCPHLNLKTLQDSGLACAAIKFVPADTEIGKPMNAPRW